MLSITTVAVRIPLLLSGNASCPRLFIANPHGQIIKMRLFLLALLALAQLACAPQPQVKPETLKNSRMISIGRSPALDQTNNTLMHLNERRDVLYQQNFGGGGVGVGLLLGPIGVAANAAAIGSNTEADVALLFGKTDVDPATVLREMLADSGLVVTDAAATVPALSPYVLVSKGENETLYFAAVLLLEYGEPGKAAWTHRYLYQLDTTLSKAALAGGLSTAQQQALRKAYREGFATLIGLYVNDIDDSYVAGKPVLLNSELLSPRFMFDLPGTLVEESDNRITVKAQGAVYSLPKPLVTLKQG